MNGVRIVVTTNAIKILPTNLQNEESLQVNDNMIERVN